MSISCIASGSSPHTRGAHGFRMPSVWTKRIIPAYAGSTRAATEGGRGMSDHPRIRGEHAVDVGADRRRCRIIPAYAGSTSFGIPCHGRLRDHPRIRGEHEMTLHKNGLVVGSSPHTRGAPVGLGAQLRDRRIIPAYAGSTWVETGGGQGMSDHPRIRGEHGASRTPARLGSGSSPHTRGAPCGCT